MREPKKKAQQKVEEEVGTEDVQKVAQEEENKEMKWHCFEEE